MNLLLFWSEGEYLLLTSSGKWGDGGRGQRSLATNEYERLKVAFAY